MDISNFQAEQKYYSTLLFNTRIPIEHCTSFGGINEHRETRFFRRGRLKNFPVLSEGEQNFQFRFHQVREQINSREMNVVSCRVHIFSQPRDEFHILHTFFSLFVVFGVRQRVGGLTVVQVPQVLQKRTK